MIDVRAASAHRVCQREHLATRAGATDTTIFNGVPGEWDRATMNKPEDVAEVVWKAWSAAADENVDDLDVPPPA